MEKELVLCDSNVLINWFKNDSSTINILNHIGLSNIVIPSIMEFYQGSLNKKELKELTNKMHNYKILHFEKKISDLAVQLILQYNLSHNLLIPDAIIAATAINYNLRLFTMNLKDFKYIAQLRLFSL